MASPHGKVTILRPLLACLLTGFRVGIESGREKVLRDEQGDGKFGGTQ